MGHFFFIKKIALLFLTLTSCSVFLKNLDKSVHDSKIPLVAKRPFVLCKNLKTKVTLTPFSFSSIAQDFLIFLEKKYPTLTVVDKSVLLGLLAFQQNRFVASPYSALTFIIKKSFSNSSSQKIISHRFPYPPSGKIPNTSLNAFPWAYEGLKFLSQTSGKTSFKKLQEILEKVLKENPLVVSSELAQILLQTRSFFTKENSPYFIGEMALLAQEPLPFYSLNFFSKSSLKLPFKGDSSYLISNCRSFHKEDSPPLLKPKTSRVTFEYFPIVVGGEKEIVFLLFQQISKPWMIQKTKKSSEAPILEIPPFVPSLKICQMPKEDSLLWAYNSPDDLQLQNQLTSFSKEGYEKIFTTPRSLLVERPWRFLTEHKKEISSSFSRNFINPFRYPIFYTNPIGASILLKQEKFFSLYGDTRYPLELIECL